MALNTIEADAMIDAAREAVVRQGDEAGDHQAGVVGRVIARKEVADVFQARGLERRVVVVGEAVDADGEPLLHESRLLHGERRRGVERRQIDDLGRRSRPWAGERSQQGRR